MRTLLRIATLVTLSACPGPAPLVDAGVEVDGGTDAGTDAGVDAGLDCRAAGLPSTAPCGTLGWQTSDAGVAPRNHHSSAVVTVDAGTFLFVGAGVDRNALYDSFQRARVNDDGSLGAFEAVTSKLPQGFGGGTMSQAGRVLVYAGGTKSSGAISDQSYYAQVQPDGTLSAWFPNESITNPRMHPASVSYNGSIYVMGGFRDPDVWSDVVKVQRYPNDTLGGWQPGGSLPGKRTHMAATVVGEYVYLTGGLAASPYGNPPTLKTVSRGKFDANGDLGEWVDQPDLPIGLCTHASAYWGGWLYVMGGIVTDGTAAQEKRVWRAPVQADHSLGAWEEVAGLPVPRGHVHDLPIFKNHVYSIGGAIDFSLNSTGAVEIGTFQ